MVVARCGDRLPGMGQPTAEARCRRCELCDFHRTGTYGYGIAAIAGRGQGQRLGRVHVGPLSGNQGAAVGSPPCFRNAHKPPGGPRPTGSLSQACGATRLDSIVRMINETALAYEPEE